MDKSRPQLVKHFSCSDERGELNIPWSKGQTPCEPAVQMNWSQSFRSVLRGLHYQWPTPQGKLVRVITGQIIDVIVDIRRDSVDFGLVRDFKLSNTDDNCLWVPRGFAHGFLVVSSYADVVYFMDEEYIKENDRAIDALDPKLKIKWPGLGKASFKRSEKDTVAPFLVDVPNEHLPIDVEY